jgi:hypothetical protein
MFAPIQLQVILANVSFFMFIVNKFYLFYYQRYLLFNKNSITYWIMYIEKLKKKFVVLRRKTDRRMFVILHLEHEHEKH